MSPCENQLARLAEVTDRSSYSWFLDMFSHLDPNSPVVISAMVIPQPPTFARLFPLLDDSQEPTFQYESTLEGLQDTYRQLVNANERSPSTSISTSADTHAYAQQQLKEGEHYIRISCATATALWAGDGRPLHLRQKLKDALEQTDPSRSWLPVPGALLWCLLVGLNYSRGDQVLYPWFAAQLLRSWTPVGFYRWDRLQQALDWFRWLLRHGPARRTREL